MSELKRMIDNNTIVVIDLETTGLDSTKNEIIEVGAVKLQNGKIIDTYSSFVKIDTPLDEKIVDLTGITDQDLVAAPSLAHVLITLNKFCQNSIIAGHNAQFDYGFIKHYEDIIGIKFEEPQIDTLALARTMLKDELKSFTLSNLANYFDILLEPHRAVNDAKATAELLLRLSNI